MTRCKCQIDDRPLNSLLSFWLQDLPAATNKTLQLQINDSHATMDSSNRINKCNKFAYTICMLLFWRSVLFAFFFLLLFDFSIWLMFWTVASIYAAWADSISTFGSWSVDQPGHWSENKRSNMNDQRNVGKGEVIILANSILDWLSICDSVSVVPILWALTETHHQLNCSISMLIACKMIAFMINVDL